MIGRIRPSPFEARPKTGSHLRVTGSVTVPVG